LWKAGDYYIGYSKNDMREGKGLYVYANKGVYFGDWKEGKQEGQGSYKSPNGQLYVGAWKNNMRHGEGTITEYGISRKSDWENDVEKKNN